jgi:hypothetical protein
MAVEKLQDTFGLCSTEFLGKNGHGAETAVRTDWPRALIDGKISLPK